MNDPDEPRLQPKSPKQARTWQRWVLCLFIVIGMLIVGVLYLQWKQGPLRLIADLKGATAILVAILFGIVLYNWPVRVFTEWLYREPTRPQAGIGFLLLVALLVFLWFWPLSGWSAYVILSEIVLATMVLTVIQAAATLHFIEAHGFSKALVSMVASYMMAVIAAFAFLFKIVQSVSNGKGPSAFGPGNNHHLSPFRLLFFSVTTFTTTGYGNIWPRSGLATSFTIAEMLVGWGLGAYTISLVVFAATTRLSKNRADNKDRSGEGNSEQS